MTTHIDIEQKRATDPIKYLEQKGETFLAAYIEALHQEIESLKKLSVPIPQPVRPLSTLELALRALDPGAMPHPEHESLVRCAIAELKKDIVAQPVQPACLHDETERLGAIWTRCTQCGKKWADDEPLPIAQPCHNKPEGV